MENETRRDNMEIYLQPTFAVDSNHERIVETAKSLTDDCSTDQDKTVKLFYFVRDSIPYSAYMNSVFIEDFKASRILEWRKGYCVQKAVLLTALGRAAGVPSRLVFAKIKNHRVPAHVFEKLGTNVFPRHGYNQFFLNGRWVTAAATFDRRLCEKNGLPTVEFNGKQDSILPDKDLSGEKYIEYIKKYSPVDDLPFDWIVRSIIKFAGPDKRPWLDRNHTVPEAE